MMRASARPEPMSLHRRGVAGDPCIKDRSVQPFDPAQSIVFADCDRADGLTCSADGVCAPLAAVGDACGLFLDCASLRCEGGVCAPGGPVGETCTSQLDCDGELYCRPNDVVCVDRDPVTQNCRQEKIVSAECAAPSGEGETCGRHVRCADSLYCTSSTAEGEGQCVAGTSYYCEAGREKLARQASKVN